MIKPGVVRPLCVLLTALIVAPGGLAQLPQAPASPPPPAAAKVAKPVPAGEPLRIVVLEGENAVNSIPLMRSVPPVIEVHDKNDFPIEGAAVVFTLPEIGPGGTFAGGATKFTTRSDSHGQAGAPLILPNTAGKFQIKVSVVYGALNGKNR